MKGRLTPHDGAHEPQREQRPSPRTAHIRMHIIRRDLIETLVRLGAQRDNESNTQQDQAQRQANRQIVPMALLLRQHDIRQEQNAIEDQGEDADVVRGGRLVCEFVAEDPVGDWAGEAAD